MIRRLGFCTCAVLLSAVAVGCGGGDNPGNDTGPPPPDGSTSDGGGRDGGRDGGTGDVGTGDAGDVDAATCTGADLCTVEGTSCSGDMLVTCATATDGCLRETATDCTTTGMICSPTGTAACVDPCAHVPVADRCTAASRACTGDTLDVCAMDAMGCFVRTQTDCAASAGGACDESGAMPVCISTADPCGGLTSCGTTTTRACSDATHLTVCDANPAGCFVDMLMTCPTGMVCDESTGTAMCVDPCTLVDVCPADTYCDANAAVTCAPDANGCLVETSRDTCAGSVCSGGACTSACPPADANAVLDCASGTITGNTSAGTTALSSYACSGLTYANHEMVYRFVSPSNARVTVLGTRDAAATGDYDLYVLDGGDGSLACSSTSSCLTHGSGTGATETVSFDARAGQVIWISYDLWTSTSSDAPFTLQVSCVVSVCGDGAVGSGETCDDSNTTDGDGCSATCAIETGSVCYGAPSVCGAANACGNGVTETGETCDDGNTSDADGCSATCAREVGWTCTSATPTTCTHTCGNGTINTGETCDDDNFVDGDGCSAACLVETGYTCDGVPSTCIPQASNATCASATAVTGTSSFPTENTLTGGASPTGTTCGSAGGPTLYYALTIPAATSVRIDAAPTGFDAVIKTEDSCGAAACNARVDSGVSGGAETTTIANATTSPITRIVAVNSFYGGTSSSAHGGMAAVSFTYTTSVCGNGAVETGETCDDGDAMAGDGCSDTCAIETGYTCSGTPSVCVLQAPNASCATAEVLDPNGGSTTGDLTGGGTRPTGTGCTGASGPVLWYSVTVPAASSTTVTATPGSAWDLVISRVSACGATGCVATRDAGSASTAESLAFVNPSSTPMTVLFSVGSYSATTFGAFTLTATTGPSPYTSIAAACVDLSAVTPIAITTGTAGDDGASDVTALPFAFSFFGVDELSYSVTTNGFMQLYPAATGTRSTAYSNSDIPSTSTPNGFIAPFWDDLHYAAGSGGSGNPEQRVLVTGTPGSQVMIVEWLAALGADSSATIRMQAMLYEGTNVIELHYCDMSTTGTGTTYTGSSATIGTENAGGTAGVRISYNTAGAATTGTAYRITP